MHFYLLQQVFEQALVFAVILQVGCSRAMFEFIASSFGSAAVRLASEQFVERLNSKMTSFATLMLALIPEDGITLTLVELGWASKMKGIRLEEQNEQQVLVSLYEEYAQVEYE